MYFHSLGLVREAINFSILVWVLKAQESRVLVLKILASVVQQKFKLLSNKTTFSN